MSRGTTTTRRATALLMLTAWLAGCVAHAPVPGPGEQMIVSSPGSDPVADAVESMRVENERLENSEQASGGTHESAAPMRQFVELEPVGATEFRLYSDDQDVVGVVQLIRARNDDTFSDIARTYGLGYDDLVLANPDVDPWLPGEGTPIVLPTQFILPSGPRVGVVLNIAAKRLFHYPDVPEGEPRRVITHPIGIGRVGWATPIGSAKVVAKAKNPTWYVPWSVRQEHLEAGNPLPAVVPPGEDNPLGHRVLKLDMEGYLIHGTNQPYGVGMRVSHGCVRLYPENIETLYDAVAIGTPVTIVNEPVLGGWRDGSFYLESHPALEDDERDLDETVGQLLDSAVAKLKYPKAYAIDAVADATVANARGYPVVLIRGASGERFAADPRPVKNIVVVDNPVSAEELEELLSANEEPQT